MCRLKQCASPPSPTLNSLKRRRTSRFIPKSPDKILDAPDLVDDYYLNLLGEFQQSTYSHQVCVLITLKRLGQVLLCMRSICLFAHEFTLCRKCLAPGFSSLNDVSSLLQIGPRATSWLLHCGNVFSYGTHQQVRVCMSRVEIASFWNERLCWYTLPCTFKLFWMKKKKMNISSHCFVSLQHIS
jgi:hypothetical protein